MSDTGMHDNDMNENFEQELKSALTRKQEPQDFARQVLARVAQKQTASPSSFSSVLLSVLRGKGFSLRHPALRWATTAALAIALIAAGIHYRNVQKERAKGEAAKQRLLLALHIAGNKLQLARTKVQQLNDDGSESQQQKQEKE